MAPDFRPRHQIVTRALQQIRGILVFAGFTINTIFWFVPVFLLGVVKLLVPVTAFRRFLTRILMWLGESWVAVNSVILTVGCSIDWQERGLQNLRRDRWYLVMANHQTWVDILVLQKVFNRRVPFLKFFIKQQLVWFPLLGLAWWALDMPFMKRFSPSYLAKNPHMKGKDLQTTRRACEKFRHAPTSIINFVEGTRFSEAKRKARKSPYRHLLPPRAGGLAVALSAMGELFNGILDVTLVYPDEPVSFWDMCCGRHVRVIVDVRELAVDEWLLSGDYEQDRKFRRSVHRWIGDIWQQKDELMERGLEEENSA
ncbi:MAG: acyltransferase [Gammaproteobacteria bacterium]|nr:acyltransferase [Gammaproteobacteria bacterium]